MRRAGLRFGIAVGATLVLLAPTFGQATRPADDAGAATRPAPATQPASSPTTQPSFDGLDRGKILQQLSSTDWRERRTATESLIRLGEPGKPFIQQLIHDAPSDEARNNALTALNQIDENRVTGTSFITLHLKHATPQQAFTELSSQAFSPLPTMPENLWQQGGFGQVNIDVDHVPFWEAAPKICQQLGVDFRPYNNTLMISRGGQMQGLSHVEGAFLIVANQINYQRSRILGAGNREQTHFGINMSIFPEPKITVLNSGSSIRLDEVVDDHGNSLIPPRGRNPGFMGYGGFGGFNLYTALQYPTRNPGTRITRFRGSTVFVVQTKMHEFQIENLLQMRQTTTTVDGIPVTFRSLKVNGDQCELHVAVPQSAMSNPQWPRLAGQIQTRLQILDFRGRELDHRGMGTNMNGQSIEYVLQFGANDGDRSRRAARLVWQIPTESREITVPIRFDDIPLFDDN